MKLNTLPVVSTSLYSNCSCWPAQSHTELWSSSMQLNFCIVHINERTFRFCIFTNLFQDGGGVLIYGPFKQCVSIKFLKLIFCSKLPIDNFEIKFYSINLILLSYNTYLCKICLVYLFEYMFNILLIG